MEHDYSCNIIRLARPAARLGGSGAGLVPDPAIATGTPMRHDTISEVGATALQCPDRVIRSIIPGPGIPPRGVAQLAHMCQYARSSRLAIRAPRSRTYATNYAVGTYGFRGRDTAASTMNTNNGLPLVAPRVIAGARSRASARPCSPSARSASSWTRRPAPCRSGSRSSRPTARSSASTTHVLPESHPQAAANAPYLERFVKFLLWSRGGWRIHVDGPEPLAARAGGALPRHRDRAVRRAPGGRADVRPSAGGRAHARICRRSTPSTKPLGRHLEGCRIGFDLGGSDRKVAAVIDGRVVFSDETVWDPYHKPDPQYHFDGIMDSLQQGGRPPAARRCHRRQRRRRLREQPRQGRLAVSRRARRTCSTRASRTSSSTSGRRGTTCPFEVVNDGEVTALAGSMSLGAERHPRHRARHQHGRRLRHAGRQHHVLAERARVRAGRLQPGRAGRRMVGRLRRRRRSTSRSSASAA